MATHNRVQIGTSGWSYNHWQGVLYPEGLLPRDRLALYQNQFQTVELNSSYYRWPTDAAFVSWRKRLPAGFQLAVKAAGAMTHRRRLYAPEAWLQRIAHGLSLLGDRAGPLLVQLPPTLPYDDARLAYFLQQLPAGHRTAMEFRHPSWHQESVFEQLARYQVAYCVMSGAQLPCVLRATARFVYVRLHGPDPTHLYGGSYSDDALRWWADRLHEWQAQGCEVYAYFNNDGEGNAVRNAYRLRELVYGG